MGWYLSSLCRVQVGAHPRLTGEAAEQEEGKDSLRSHSQDVGAGLGVQIQAAQPKSTRPGCYMELMPPWKSVGSHKEEARALGEEWAQTLKVAGGLKHETLEDIKTHQYLKNANKNSCHFLKRSRLAHV